MEKHFEKVLWRQTGPSSSTINPAEGQNHPRAMKRSSVSKSPDFHLTFLAAGGSSRGIEEIILLSATGEFQHQTFVVDRKMKILGGTLDRRSKLLL